MLEGSTDNQNWKTVTPNYSEPLTRVVRCSQDREFCSQTMLLQETHVSWSYYRISIRFVNGLDLLEKNLVKRFIAVDVRNVQKKIYKNSSATPTMDTLYFH